MTCDPLPNTGIGAAAGLILILAAVCLALGTILLVLSRRRKGASTALAILLVASAAVALTPGTPAQAADSDCVTGNNSLTITQTSTMQGLAPGIAPVAVTGLVVNNSSDSTYITAVDVEISSVTRRPGSSPGTCDASDYVLVGTRMPVGRTLGPGGSTSFAGASIGFHNKTTNQDSCRNATIRLLYTANPH